MLIHSEHDHLDLVRLETMFDVETEILGATRRPLPLAIGSLASALVVLALCPLTSLIPFAAIVFFLLLAVYFFLATDVELARRHRMALVPLRNEHDRT